MANITDPAVVKYSNERIRPIANTLVGLSSALDIEIAKWNATIAPALVPFAGDDVVLDGSAEDGRTPITKTDLENFVTQMQTIQTQFDGAGVFDVISKPHVNPRTP